MVADCPSDWLAQTDVLMEIGYAYGRLGQFESAGEYLAAALAGDGDDGTTTLRAVAELANFEALLADHYTEAQAARTRELHKLAISRLEKLIAVAATSERYSLLGSVYKRRAAAERNARNARQALTQAGEKYQLAHELSCNARDSIRTGVELAGRGDAPGPGGAGRGCLDRALRGNRERGLAKGPQVLDGDRDRRRRLVRALRRAGSG